MSDWFYRLGRALLNQSVRLYYRRVEVVGREYIPTRGPGVIVANHPNSIPDAFLLASQLTSRPVHFIAKDTITRLPVVGWLARRFGVVGVARALEYERQRDLARQRNQAAIDTCVPRLVAGGLLAIFGEGISTDARRLHTIRKGAMRFGYAAERAAGFQLGVVWIPVGINYSAKQHFRSDVVLRVGKPFALRELLPDPAAHEHDVLQRGTQRLQREVESLIVNIERDELAALIDQLTDLLGSPAGSLAARVERQQRIARAVQYFNVAEPDRLAAVEQGLRRYQQALRAADLSDEVVRQRHPTVALWVNLLGALQSSALMALNLYGWANSLVPRWTAALLRPLGRRRLAGQSALDFTREALYGTYGGWVGAAVAFPLQIYVVTQWAVGRYGVLTAVVVSTLYGLSLIPAWRLFLRRRDILRERFAATHNALRFLLNALPATRLQRRRRQLQRRLRGLLAAYDRQAPRAA